MRDAASESSDRSKLSTAATSASDFLAFASLAASAASLLCVPKASTRCANFFLKKLNFRCETRPQRVQTGQSYQLLRPLLQISWPLHLSLPAPDHSSVYRRLLQDAQISFKKLNFRCETRPRRVQTGQSYQLLRPLLQISWPLHLSLPAPHHSSVYRRLLQDAQISSILSACRATCG